MTITRTEHWATREFHAFLLLRAHAPFVWGGNDCALFAADGILAMSGVDVASEFRGQYADEAGAFAAVKRICNGTTVADAAAHCAAAHGLVEWDHPKLAQRGDLVVFQNGSSLIAGLVHLSGRHIVSPGDEGLLRFSISLVQRAWHV